MDLERGTYLKISIITAVFNSKKTIACCIESVRKQRYKPEHIIIDGQSSDGSVEIINRCRMNDSIFLSEPDRGFYDAINKGLRMASGDVIGILNADDMYANNVVLERVMDSFEKSISESCYGDLVYVDPIDTEKVCRYWSAGSFHAGRFLRGWMPPHPTFFVRREIYEKYGGFNLELGTAADYELMLRFLVKHEITTQYIPEVLIKMRMGGQSNATLRRRLLANRMDRMAWKVNGLRPYPWTLILKPLSKIGQYFAKPPEPNSSTL